MTNFLKELQDLAVSRVNNTLFLTFIIAWATINYDFTLTLLFSDIPINEKINYIQSFSFSCEKTLLYPSLITLFYQLMLPLLNLLLTMVKDVTVDKWIMNNKNNSLIKYYKEKREVEKEKVKTENIAREYEIELKEKELNLEKEGLDTKEFKDYKEFKNNNKYPPGAITQEEVNSDYALAGLSDESKILLKETSSDKTGTIWYSKDIGGSAIRTNNKNFLESNERREMAKWEAALNQLQEEELIIDKSGKGEQFKITDLGYKIADSTLATN